MAWLARHNGSYLIGDRHVGDVAFVETLVQTPDGELWVVVVQAEREDAVPGCERLEQFVDDGLGVVSGYLWEAHSHNAVRTELGWGEASGVVAACANDSTINLSTRLARRGSDMHGIYLPGSLRRL